MKKDFSIFILFFLTVIVIFFNPFFLRGKPLFPGNLLASFYSPWKYQEFTGWEGSIPNKPLGFDNLRFFYPIRKEISNQLSFGKIPLWNPYNFSGNVILGDSQSATFYPFNILYLVLPFMTGWSLLIIFVPLAAGIFTYLFLRTYKVSPLASFLGAVTFSFSGFMIAWMEENPAVSHSAIWLPVALFGIRKFLQTRSVGFWLLAIFSLVFSVFAGFLQISIYLWVFAFSFGLYELFSMEKSERKKIIVPFLAVFVFALLISAVHLIPSFEGYLNSPRVTASAAYLAREYLVPLTHLATLVAPDIYGNPGSYNYFGGGFYYDKIIYAGLIPLIFCFYAVFSREKKIKFFFFGLLITLILGFSNPVSAFVMQLKIPFISMVTPSRIFYLTDFMISILAAFGLETFMKNRDLKTFIKTALSLLVFFFISGLVIYGLYNSAVQKVTPSSPLDLTDFSVSLRNMVLPLAVSVLTLIVMFYLLKKNKGLIFLTTLLVAVLVFHQYYFFKKTLYVTDDNHFIFSETKVIEYLKKNSALGRTIGVGEAQIFPNFLLPFHLFSSDGLDPVFPRRYGEFMNVANGRSFTTDIPRIEARLFFEKTEDFSNKNKLRTLTFLGIKYLIAPSKTTESKSFILPENQFKKVYDDDKVAIWENKKVLPRCWLSINPIVREKPEDILNTLFSDDFDPEKSVILEQKIPEGTSEVNGSPGTVQIVAYSSDSMKIKTNTDKTSLLFCTENYYPGWKVRIDPSASPGQAETKLYRADYTFRAVSVPKGSHEIVFEYQPLSFRYGAIISTIGILLTIVYGIFLKRKQAR